MADLTRRTFLKGAARAGGLVVRPPAVLGQAKPFAGVTIRGSSFQHVFHTYLKEYLPEFEAKTGMTVDFAPQAFPVYNQRADLELSTQGSAWDFLNITFIYSGRWIGAGWFAPLDELVNDRNQTPREWDAADFVSGAQSSLVDARGATYGFAWEAGAMLMGAGRADLGARQQENAGAGRAVAAGQARGEQGKEHRPLRAEARRPRRSVSRLQQPRLRHPRGRKEQARGVGVHLVGDEQGNAAAHHDREGLHHRVPALDHRRSRLSQVDDVQRAGRGRALP